MTLKILSLNLFEGGILWDNIVTFLHKEQPDILCLQEVIDGSADQPTHFQSITRLKKVLPDFHYFFSPELYEVSSKGEGDIGNAIFSRFPLSNQQTIFLNGKYQKVNRPEDKEDFSTDPKNLQSCLVTVAEKSIHVLNLHGIWGLDGGDNPDRLEMSEKIIGVIRDKLSLVLMGDFNVRPDTQTIRNIEKHLVNVFKDELTTSFNMRHKTNPGYATAVVDMFFATSDLTIVSHCCPDDDVSDHKPLVVMIEM